MIEELHRFLITAQEGNVTRAAEKIFITQSALSQSIKRLELELGTKLFIQQGKHLQLTPDGKATIIIGKKILQLWHNAKDPAIRSNQRKKFSVGLYDNAALRLGKYLQNSLTSGDFDIELTINSSGNLFPQLRLGLLDIAICVNPAKQSPSQRYQCIETFREELIPVSSIQHHENLDAVPFILYNQRSNTREQCDKTFIEHGLSPRIFAESTSTTFMKELAILGNGVALLPSNFVRSEIKLGTLKKQKLPFKIYREFGLYIKSPSEITKDHELVRAMSTVLRKTTI